MRALVVSKAFVSATYRQKLDELAGLGVEVVAVSPAAWREGGTTQPLEPEGTHQYDLRVLPLRFNGHFHLHWYGGLARLISTTRPDIVHLDEEPYNLATFLGMLAARRAGVATLFFTWQNLDRRYPPPFRDMERACYRWAGAAIAGNADAADVLRAKGYRGPVAVIPQFGVDPARFAPGERKESPFTVGYFNRLVPGKAPLEAVAAFSALPPSSRLLVVGDGPLRGAVEREVERLGLGKRVTLRPRAASSAVPELMRGLDALILPSRTMPGWKEQFGRVLIEAMACGVPVIGSDSGEIPNVIGDAGLIVPEGDVTALGAALERVLGDTALRRDLGARGRERVLQRFTHRRVAEATVEAYRLALQRR